MCDVSASASVVNEKVIAKSVLTDATMTADMYRPQMTPASNVRGAGLRVTMAWV